MAANMRDPKPVSPIKNWPHLRISVQCRTAGCFNSRTVVVGEVAKLHRLAPEMALYQLTERLSCSLCGQRDCLIKPLKD